METKEQYFERLIRGLNSDNNDIVIACMSALKKLGKVSIELVN